MPSYEQISGMNELAQKLNALKDGFNGRQINTVCLNAAKQVAKAVRKNLKRGPTGNLLAAVQAVSGRKAWKYGGAAIARINAWLAPHAHLVEAGTKAYSGLMKIPLSAVSQEWWMKLTTAQRIQAGKRGYIFISARTGAPAQHPFEKAVESEIGNVQQILRDGSKQIVGDAIR